MDWDSLIAQSTDDQRGAALTDAFSNTATFVALVRAYYVAAIDRDFRRSEALALTIAFQAELLRANKPVGPS